jgi:hypothetical protein
MIHIIKDLYIKKFESFNLTCRKRIKKKLMLGHDSFLDRFQSYSKRKKIYIKGVYYESCGSFNLKFEVTYINDKVIVHLLYKYIIKNIYISIIKASGSWLKSFSTLNHLSSRLTARVS